MLLKSTSIRVIPKLHISAVSEYPNEFLVTTSGTKKWLVPIIVDFLSKVEASWLLIPKSPRSINLSKN